MDEIRKVEYYYTQVPDRSGEGARVLAALADAGVNLLAFTGFPAGRKAQLDFVPEDPAAFKAAAKRAGVKLSARKIGFFVQGMDRVGAVAGAVSKLARAKISVTAAQAVCAGEGRYAAIIWVKPKDLGRAAKALGV